MKKILAAIKDKTNWGSFVMLTLALASALVGIFMPDDKLSVKALSLAVGLITVEFFLLIVVHLEDIQGALKRVENREPKGPQIRKRDVNLPSQLIAEVKEELFFSSTTLTRLIDSRSALLALSDKIHVRLLVMDVEDKAVCDNRETVFDRRPVTLSMSYLDCFTSKPNIEIRTAKFPQTMHFSARDMDRHNGSIHVEFPIIWTVGLETPGVDLIPADELYELYKNQIERLWDKGTPWESK